MMQMQYNSTVVKRIFVASRPTHMQLEEKQTQAVHIMLIYLLIPA